MARTLPEKCCRDPERPECRPMCCIRSDPASGWDTGGGSFVCGGLVLPQFRNTPEDEYRFCFVNEKTDTMYTHELLDVLDMCEVMARTVSTAHRIAENGA